MWIFLYGGSTKGWRGKVEWEDLNLVTACLETKKGIAVIMEKFIGDIKGSIDYSAWYLDCKDWLVFDDLALRK